MENTQSENGGNVKNADVAKCKDGSNPEEALVRRSLEQKEKESANIGQDGDVARETKIETNGKEPTAVQMTESNSETDLEVVTTTSGIYGQGFKGNAHAHEDKHNVPGIVENMSKLTQASRQECDDSETSDPVLSRIEKETANSNKDSWPEQKETSEQNDKEVQIYSTKRDSPTSCGVGDPTAGYVPDVNKVNKPYNFRTELRFRIIKTGCLVTTWICIGLFTEMSGPTFKDLELRLDLPKAEATEAVSRATSGRSLGFFAGAFIGGFLVDRFKGKGDLFIGLSLFCASAVTIVVPWMSTFVTMWFFMFCQGTFEGIINVAGQEIILLLWGEKSAGPMHLLHFGFGMGSFINPLIAQPFLAVKQTSFLNGSLVGDNFIYEANVTNTTTIDTLVGSRIEYAFLIAAVITAVFSSTFFWYQYRGVPDGGYMENIVPKAMEKKHVKGWKQYIGLVDPATCADGKRLAGFALFALLFLYFFQAVGGERIYSKFIRNYALDQEALGFSSTEASYLNSSFWISFSIGRFLGFIVAIWVPIRILILVECFSALGFATLLNIFGHDNKLALWVLTQPMGLFVAPLFPSGVAWSDHYLKMSGVGIMILIAGGSLGGVVYIWVLGYVYPTFGPSTFLYMVEAYAVAAVVCVGFLSFAGYKHGDRFLKERLELDVKEDEDRKETITFSKYVETDAL